METAKEYLKEKGLKNPPLDSGISGGGDAPRRYVSDLMQEWSDLNSKYRDKKIAVLETIISTSNPNRNAMKWYCIVKPGYTIDEFKESILYQYKTNNEGDTQAFNGKNWFWINTSYFLMLHTI